MEHENKALFSRIKKMILKQYPSINVAITTDDDYIVFSINDKNIYYSSAFLLLITEINRKMLWAKGIYNVLFVLEAKKLQKDIDRLGILSVEASGVLSLECMQDAVDVVKAISIDFTKLAEEARKKRGN